MTRSNLYWEVTYKTGEKLTKDSIVYPNINRELVEKVSLKNSLNEEVYFMNLDKGDSFSYRRRTRTDGVALEVCHILAKFTPVGKKIAFVFESDGSIVIKDGFMKNHRWFYSPAFNEYEFITTT
jgi:hypothetical protein